METVLLVIHLLIALALVGVILIQRSEGGGLGIGGGTMGGMMTTRGSANLLTRTTAILAAGFMTTSIILAILAGGHSRPTSIIDSMPAAPAQQQAPQPAVPATPAPPVAQ
ncbi:preprotein translocase subunit SecG [Azospirillum sp. RWY-5-1]|uniref:Protein-export membrane protein SecG n=1 Tax=Azospirillum oleiclasticum TaxID=2735135 RepID=A0ABX2T4H6_9PROT|nr:preprotein translocase subunit SecG [Azospirillum oleiclasticum]NYZ11944.1 preprotein translocase subunit SecG [Azospirillum oleiclasticum]NYZ19104.1 preprotein translocase subunit SecG [Azospirillum oleiclasticum]